MLTPGNVQTCRLNNRAARCVALLLDDVEILFPFNADVLRNHSSKVALVQIHIGWWRSQSIKKNHLRESP